MQEAKTARRHILNKKAACVNVVGLRNKFYAFSALGLNVTWLAYHTSNKPTIIEQPNQTTQTSSSITTHDEEKCQSCDAM